MLALIKKNNFYNNFFCIEKLKFLFNYMFATNNFYFKAFIAMYQLKFQRR